MSMEMKVIMIDERGNIIMPTDIVHVWMSEPELVELFGVIAPTLRAAVRAVYKSGVLKEYEVQKYVRLENGYYADMFGFPMIAALAFRINTVTIRCSTSLGGIKKSVSLRCCYYTKSDKDLWKLRTRRD